MASVEEFWRRKDWLLQEWPQVWNTKGVSVGSLSNNDGDSYENVIKKWIRAATNFIALIPSRLILQMLANVFGVEF